MKTRRITADSYRVFVVALLLTGACATTWAQDDDGGPTYINFRVQAVKQDRIAEWERLRKEMSDAARSAGRGFYHVYQRQRGPGPGFLIVTPEEGIGERSGAIDPLPPLNVPRSWFDAISDTLDSQLVLSLQYYPNLATMQDPGHPSAKFMHLRIRTAAAGRGGDFEDWLRDDLIPALREAEVGDVRNARVVLGGNPRTWVTASFVDGWPYAPGNPVSQRMLAKGDALVATRNDYFYEFREDLSFTAE